MKGVYTAGVLDLFLDRGILFSRVYGVSAGAVHMCSYLSGQRGRALDVSVDYLDLEAYCGMRSLLTTGNFFHVTTGYHLIPEYLSPFDFEAFERYEGRAYSVATDIVSGRPEYFQMRNMREDIVKIQASASLPLVSRKVKINGGYYLDGGISDAIPLRKSVMDGNQKNVVVMTKETGFVRGPESDFHMALIKARYFKYPKVGELMGNRHARYQETLDYIEQQRETGHAFVIRPKKAGSVGRIERDREKLLALYEEGYQDAADCYEELKTYLEQGKPQSEEGKA